MVNAKASAVGIVIPWCDKDGRDEEGHPWHTREPDLLQCYSYVQKNYQHFRTPNHIVFFIVLPSGLSLNGIHFIFIFIFIFLLYTFNLSFNFISFRNSLFGENWNF